jgi:SAM-dependent methyltransferase
MRRGPNSRLARERYDRLAPGYDRRFRHFQGLLDSARRRAVGRLCLGPGKRVLDVGCGTGASFALLEEVVGPGGSIIGIEQSPGMLAHAAARVEASGWHNVTLLEASAQEAKMSEAADAALFFFTHDVIRSPQALDNILANVKHGGHVAAAGAKLGPWWLRPLGLLGLLLVRPYVTTFDGIACPWTHLASRVHAFEIEELALDFFYVASGRVGWHPPSRPNEEMAQPCARAAVKNMWDLRRWSVLSARASAR